jgi:hypothetical protein
VLVQKVVHQPHLRAAVLVQKVVHQPHLRALC